MNDIIRFHVPCKMEFTKLVEDFSDLIAAQLNIQSNSQFGSKLRTVMNEVFINIVKHSNTAANNEVVRFQFELGIKYFTISVYDYGPGFEADAKLPPYPDKLVGKQYKLRDVLDGKVSFVIVDPFSISFRFDEKEDVNLDFLDELDNVDENGRGISIITKLMDSVTYSYIGEGKFDWKLIKKIA